MTLGSGAGGRFRAADAHAFNVPLYLLSYSSVGTRPRESNPVVAVLRTAAFPLGKVGLSRLAPGKGLEPPSRGSEPRVLPLDDPGALAPSTGIEPAFHCSTGSRPLQGTTRARCIERGGGAPGRIRTPTAAGHGVTTRWVRSCPSRRALHSRDVWLAMPIRFSRCSPGSSGQKEKGPGVARPLCRLPV